MMLAQIEGLKDTALYVPVMMVALAFGGFAFGYRWMRSTSKAEVSEQIAPLQAQIEEQRQQIVKLIAQVRMLQNGHQKAAKSLMSALNEPDNWRNHVNAAFDALSGIIDASDLPNV